MSVFLKRETPENLNLHDLAKTPDQKIEKIRNSCPRKKCLPVQNQIYRKTIKSYKLRSKFIVK